MKKKKFPGALWLLPILLGIPGGIIASLIASLKYQASWWELLAVGFASAIFVSLVYVAIYISMLEVILTPY